MEPRPFPPLQLWGESWRFSSVLQCKTVNLWHQNNTTPIQYYNIHRFAYDKLDKLKTVFIDEHRCWVAGGLGLALLGNSFLQYKWNWKKRDWISRIKFLRAIHQIFSESKRLLPPNRILISFLHSVTRFLLPHTFTCFWMRTLNLEVRFRLKSPITGYM